MPRAAFLEKRSYRLRRLMDAVRLLPFLGLALWLVPLMWPLPAGDAAPMPMSSALLYLFGIWVLLVLGCLALWGRTRNRPDAAPDGADQQGQG